MSMPLTRRQAKALLRLRDMESERGDGGALVGDHLWVKDGCAWYSNRIVAIRFRNLGLDSTWDRCRVGVDDDPANSIRADLALWARVARDGDRFDLADWSHWSARPGVDDDPDVSGFFDLPADTTVAWSVSPRPLRYASRIIADQGMLQISVRHNGDGIRVIQLDNEQGDRTAVIACGESLNNPRP